MGIFSDVVLGTEAILRRGGKREGGLKKFKLGDFFFLDSGRQHGTHDRAFGWAGKCVCYQLDMSCYPSLAT